MGVGGMPTSSKKTNGPLKRHLIYIILIGTAYVAVSAAFDFLPRSTYSHLEKRDLTKRPSFTCDGFLSGTFATSFSHWFSDTEPYRDELLTISMIGKDLVRLHVGGAENISFHASTDVPSDPDAEALRAAEEAREADERYIDDLPLTENGTAKIANAGIIIVGEADSVRALMAFGGSSKGGVQYANAANAYHEALPGVNIYCMVIPTAVDFYLPQKARKSSNPERPVINNIYSHLASGVKAVDAYTPLAQHFREPIFLRTDHHWSPLGGYYAAQAFARVAGVPFQPLSKYTRKVVRRYVGSMYGYSGDIAIRNAPEDFVYYVPEGVSYTTTYTDYRIDEHYRVTGEGRTYNGPFFYHYRDGSGGAYCTLMGSDTRIVRVRTSTKSDRRLLILKDSFGNMLPAFLFYSFGEVHVVDFRYFTRNMKQYVRDNHITDILFCNNIFNAYSPHICARYVKYLHQAEGTYVKPQARTVSSDSVKLTVGKARPAVPASVLKKIEKAENAEQPEKAVAPQTPSESEKTLSAPGEVEEVEEPSPVEQSVTVVL